MDDQIAQAFCDRLGAKIKPKNYYGFDPSIIIAILAAIVQALQGVCPKPAPAQVKRGGIIMRVRTMAIVNQSCPTLSYNERLDLTDSILDVGREAKPDEIQKFLRA